MSDFTLPEKVRAADACQTGSQATGVQAFDYPPQLEPLTRQLRMNLAAASHHMLDAGLLLLQAKEILPHGQFQIWLQHNFNMSSKTANRFMSIAKMVKKHDLDSDMIEKLTNIDISIIYEISAKSTSEELQSKFFEHINNNMPINQTMIKLFKKNLIQELETQVICETEFQRFMDVLKQFSSWFDQHQTQLQNPQSQIQNELKPQLEVYAKKLKAASDVVDEILAQANAIPFNVNLALETASKPYLVLEETKV